MSNFIHDISAHGVLYDISSDRAANSHYSKTADWCVDDSVSTYHFSASNIGKIPLYDTDSTKVLNEVADVITPKFTNEDNIPAVFYLKNNIERKSNNIVTYTAVDTQKNYTINIGSYTWAQYQSMTEFQGGYNTNQTSNASVRVPFKFTVCVTRKANTGYTPDFDHSKPLAKITTIYGESIDNLYINGPTYILGTCIARRAASTGNQAYPNTTYRNNSREMFFYMNCDKTSTNYGGVYLAPANCKTGTTNNSVYHCSYTETMCMSFPCVELHFNTTLYVMYA